MEAHKRFAAPVLMLRDPGPLADRARAIVAAFCSNAAMQQRRARQGMAGAVLMAAGGWNVCLFAPGGSGVESAWMFVPVAAVGARCPVACFPCFVWLRRAFPPHCISSERKLGSLVLVASAGVASDRLPEWKSWKLHFW